MMVKKNSLKKDDNKKKEKGDNVDHEKDHLKKYEEK